MRVEQLELHNFRFFAHSHFSFPAQFTVLIGENGRGKSALLHGLRVAAGAWLLGFKETERLHIEPEDIRRVELASRFAPQFPAIVRAKGVVEGQAIEWARQRADFKGGLGRTGWAETKQLLDLARGCDAATNERMADVALPVLVYFSTARLWVGAKKGVDLKAKGSKIYDGYAQALTPEHKRKGPAGRTMALAWIKTNYLKVLEGFNWLRTDLAASSPVASPIAPPVLLEAVFKAIMTCIPDWVGLRWDLESDDLVGLYQRPDAPHPEWVPLYYLSDGLRTMAGMVAEIAYRCVILNGHLGAEAVRESRGLVLIDELDMHLHPNWQRRVVADLKKAFPNLQFVVTTHSPFIVQSLSSLELINLDHASDVQPKDLRLEDVATEVMNVESPLSIDNQRAEQLALTYLQELHTADQETSDKLAVLEDAVSDPGLRAILRMERLLKEAKQ
jgi:predicted ATP-binding protein involved in virulence